MIDPTRRRPTAKPVSETMSRPLILVLILIATTRLSLYELAGMDCNRHGDCKQYRERCPFIDEPAVCVRQ